MRREPMASANASRHVRPSMGSAREFLIVIVGILIAWAIYLGWPDRRNPNYRWTGVDYPPITPHVDPAKSERQCLVESIKFW